MTAYNMEQMKAAHKAYKENTDSIKKTPPRYDIKCKKGLWAVSATTEDQAKNEAMRYFMQYYEDGEYD